MVNSKFSKKSEKIDNIFQIVKKLYSIAKNWQNQKDTIRVEDQNEDSKNILETPQQPKKKKETEKIKQKNNFIRQVFALVTLQLCIVTVLTHILISIKGSYDFLKNNVGFLVVGILVFALFYILTLIALFCHKKKLENWVKVMNFIVLGVFSSLFLANVLCKYFHFDNLGLFFTSVTMTFTLLIFSFMTAFAYITKKEIKFCKTIGFLVLYTLIIILLTFPYVYYYFPIVNLYGLMWLVPLTFSINLLRSVLRMTNRNKSFIKIKLNEVFKAFIFSYFELFEWSFGGECWCCVN